MFSAPLPTSIFHLHNKQETLQANHHHHEQPRANPNAGFLPPTEHFYVVTSCIRAAYCRHAGNGLPQMGLRCVQDDLRRRRGLPTLRCSHAAVSRRDAGRKRSKDLLLQYHDFIIMDDKKFNGATKLQIRKHFVAWIAEQKDIGVIPESAFIHTWLIPRFTHCLVVDKASMQNFTDYENWAPPYLPVHRPPPACALVDANWKSPGKGSAVCEPIENCRKSYVGWMYITLNYIVGMYSENNSRDFEDEGIRNYSRPPQIVPIGLDAIMPEVDN